MTTLFSVVVKLCVLALTYWVSFQAYGALLSSEGPADGWGPIFYIAACGAIPLGLTCGVFKSIQEDLRGSKSSTDAPAAPSPKPADEATSEEPMSQADRY